MNRVHQRLIKHVLRGDPVARQRLTREARRRNADLGALTESLLGHPCQGAWRRIVSALERWTADDPPLETTLAYAACLLDAWPDPLRRAPTHWTGRLLRTLGEEPRLAVVRVLHVFARSDLDAHGLRILARSPYLANLSQLTLQQIRLDPRELSRLAAGHTFQNLTFLDLSCNPIGDVGARALASSPRLAGLEHLRLHTCGLTDAGAIALALSPHLTQLRSIDLAQNHITSLGFMALAESPALARLESIGLGFNRVTDEALYQVQPIGPLQRVNVYRNPVQSHRSIWSPA